jgi:hypothetical protein
MTFSRYEAATERQRVDEHHPLNFNGGATRNRLSKITGHSFQPRPDLIPNLKDWAEGLLGSGALKDLQEGKWRF